MSNDFILIPGKQGITHNPVSLHYYCILGLFHNLICLVSDFHDIYTFLQ